MTERGRVFVALEGPARPARSAINLLFFRRRFLSSDDPFKWQFHISVCDIEAFGHRRRAPLNTNQRCSVETRVDVSPIETAPRTVAAQRWLPERCGRSLLPY